MPLPRTPLRRPRRGEEGWAAGERGATCVEKSRVFTSHLRHGRAENVVVEEVVVAELELCHIEREAFRRDLTVMRLLSERIGVKSATARALDPVRPTAYRRDARCRKQRARSTRAAMSQAESRLVRGGGIVEIDHGTVSSTAAKMPLAHFTHFCY